MTQPQLKLKRNPYGIAAFSRLQAANYVYVDKTRSARCARANSGLRRRKLQSAAKLSQARDFGSQDRSH